MYLADTDAHHASLPYMLTNNDVKKFQEIYKAHTGLDLTFQEAYDQSMRLLRFVKAVHGFMEPEFEKINQPCIDDS
jgi:hypothetical protein